MSSSDESDTSDYVDDADCVLPSSGAYRFVRAEYEISERQKAFWDKRPQRPGQNEKRREKWLNKQLNSNSLFKWSSQNHKKTIGGIEQAQAEIKRLEALDDPPPF